jgi:uncharacterized membrane protein
MKEEPELIEKIIGALTYITMGMAGFVWLIIGLFTKARLKTFLQFHIFQSIFLALAFAVISIFVGWVSNLLSVIPLINKVVAQINFLLNMPWFFNYSFIQVILYAFLFYLAIQAFRGKYSYVPWVSEVIGHNISH